jgi:beta-lactamase class A
MMLAKQIEALCAGFDGAAGVSARNLTTGEAVSVNGRARYPTASMIKAVILFELVRQCAKGQAQMWERVTLRGQDKTLGSGVLSDLDDGVNLTLRDLAVLMMSISDNTATNILLDRLSLHAVNQACRDAGMYDTEVRGRIDFDRIRESNDNLAVGTPDDFAQFFCALRRCELIPAGQVEQMLGIMRIQKYIEPIRKYLPYNPYGDEFGQPQQVWVASKTGSLQGARCEGGLVHTPTAEWALCVMTKDSPDAAWNSEHAGIRLISAASKLIYDAWSGTGGN